MTTHLTPTISCIVPVYNSARFIGEALDSILNQQHSVSQIVVVDDGSTDDLDAALSNYDQRISVIRQENRGPAAARNRGIQESNGEFLTFLDADDLWR